MVFFFVFLTPFSYFNFTKWAHLNEQIHNINLTIASRPDAYSLKEISSSDSFETFLIDIIDEDLAENILYALQIMQ